MTVAFSPDGKLIASGSKDGTARLWSLATGKEVVKLVGHGTEVTMLTFSSDGKLLLSGSPFGVVKVMDTQTGKERIALRPGREISAAGFGADGKTVLFADTMGKVVVSDLATGKEKTSFGNSVQGLMAFSPDGRLFAGRRALDNRSVQIWDLTIEKELMTLKGRSDFGRAVFSHDGKTLASAGQDMVIRLWDLSKSE